MENTQLNELHISTRNNDNGLPEEISVKVHGKQLKFKPITNLFKGDSEDILIKGNLTNERGTEEMVTLRFHTDPSKHEGGEEIEIIPHSQL